MAGQQQDYQGRSLSWSPQQPEHAATPDSQWPAAADSQAADGHWQTADSQTGFWQPAPDSQPLSPHWQPTPDSQAATVRNTSYGENIAPDQVGFQPSHPPESNNGGTEANSTRFWQGKQAASCNGLTCSQFGASTASEKVHHQCHGSANLTHAPAVNPSRLRCVQCPRPGLPSAHWRCWPLHCWPRFGWCCLARAKGVLQERLAVHRTTTHFQCHHYRSVNWSWS
jgi:hypothetical protein